MHAEIRRDAIAEFVPNPVRVRLVGKDINESWGDYQIAGVNDGLSVDAVGRDQGDAVADETDVGDRVVTSCRIHDTTASDGGIEERRRRRWLVGRVQLWRCDLFWFFDLDRRWTWS